MIHLLATVLWAAAFFFAALFGVDAAHGGVALTYFVHLYFALGLAIHGAVLLGDSFGPAGRFAAAWGGCVLLVFHIRELTYRPSSLLLVPLIALLLAAAIFFATFKLAPISRRRAVALGLVGATLCATLAAIPFVSSSPESDLLRWHLLRHHKMFGTPLYYAFSTPVEELEERAFAAQRESAVEGPQEVTLPDVADLAPSERPHLVYLLLDTLRADGLEQMPRLQARLDAGYRFADVLAGSTWTRPSMATMMTGLTPEEHGARDVDDPLDETLQTLPEILSENGWATAAIVTNVGAVGRGAGFAQGYEEFYELDDRPYARAAKVRRMAEGWLDRRVEQSPDDDRPVFLYLHVLDPHEPYLAGVEPSAKTADEYRAAYAAELEELDRELEALLSGLEARFDRPWGLFVGSDHGEEFFEHEEFGHGLSLYGEVAHIPAAFAVYESEGAAQAGSSASLDARLEGRDLFDFILRWTLGGGVLDPAAWAASRARDQRYTAIYYSTAGRLVLRPYLSRIYMRAVEKEGWKLIWSAYGETLELYDLTNDPAEQQNLVLQRPEIVRELVAELERTITQWRFPAPYERSQEEQEQLKALGYLDP